MIFLISIFNRDTRGHASILVLHCLRRVKCVEKNVPARSKDAMLRNIYVAKVR